MLQTSSAPLLQVEDLQTYFFTRRGVVKAVDGVSFSVAPGETLGIVGESGSGKTMTSLSLLRLVPQPGGKIVGGKVLFEGVDLLKLSEADMRDYRGAKISMILQDPMASLNPVYTVGEQVAEPLRQHQKLRGQALWSKVIDALRLLRIPAPQARLRNYPHQMSGGMRQRVVGGIAISCRPQLIIADEPTTALDATIQAQYLALLKDVQRQTNVGMIFVSHDLSVIGRMCDRVAVMYAGKIVETAGVRELFNHPKHPYTAALLASVPRLDQKVERLASIEGQPPALIDLPPGCRFAPRCALADERCTREDPPRVQVGEKHFASCWRASE
ncbi:MAG TPA: ABC transporter ATP-binding protein [Chloroflexota bacterium]|nr:ABC transporter ATP-binding protein [Chloroflexota bacterium]